MSISQKLAECQAKLSNHLKTDMRRSLDFLIIKWQNKCVFCTEMDASLVGAPDFKPARGALTLSQIGSIPMHLRQSTENTTLY